MEQRYISRKQKHRARHFTSNSYSNPLSVSALDSVTLLDISLLGFHSVLSASRKLPDKGSFPLWGAFSAYLSFRMMKRD
jgi:hypothetical protein